MAVDPLAERLAALGRSLGEREAAERDALAAARSRADALHARVAAALARFHDAAGKAGAPHLTVEIGAPRLDDKHVRAVQFDLRRGRTTAIVTVKSRGEITLVGPFRMGKAEGPCHSFPFDADDELRDGLGDFLARFVEEAVAP